jgi:hypothetical protein
VERMQKFIPITGLLALGETPRYSVEQPSGGGLPLRSDGQLATLTEALLVDVEPHKTTVPGAELRLTSVSKPPTANSDDGAPRLEGIVTRPTVSTVPKLRPLSVLTMRTMFAGPRASGGRGSRPM